MFCAPATKHTQCASADILLPPSLQFHPYKYKHNSSYQFLLCSGVDKKKIDLNFSLNLVYSDFQQTEWLHCTTHFICSQILKCPHKFTKCFIVCKFVFCAWSKFNRLGNSTSHQLLFRGPLFQQMSAPVLTIDN